MTDDGFEDEEALEEHLETVKPDPVDQEELEELVEPTCEMRTVQDDEQAAVDDVAGGSDGGVDAAGSADSGLDELAEPVSEFRTVQEQDAAAKAGDDDE